MAAIPRYRPQGGLAVLSAGFRPFFLLAALWACLAVPASIAFVTACVHPPTAFPPIIWHVHEMAFGFGGAVVAGFLLTAIPNWTGRMPLQGGSLAFLVLLWLAGRIALSPFVNIGPNLVAALDLSFPAVFLVVVAREIIVSRNWRNLPIAGALAFLLLGNLLTHLQAMGIAGTAEMGNRIGVATLLMLITLIGGRIIPSFTHNWLVKQQPAAATPTPFDLVDRAALTMTSVALLTWAVVPQALVAPWLELGAGATLGLRLARWRGAQTLREPLLWVLHLGYSWLALGLLLLGVNSLTQILPQTTALHALTVGAIGTMTLAVMTRASLGHTGRPLVAGTGTTAIYVSITLAATLRLLAPLFGEGYMVVLSLAGAAWSVAYGLFVLLYARPLTEPRDSRGVARRI
jgi:uncharacterized protein involved in response to NO